MKRRERRGLCRLKQPPSMPPQWSSHSFVVQSSPDPCAVRVTCCECKIHHGVSATSSRPRSYRPAPSEVLWVHDNNIGKPRHGSDMPCGTASASGWAMWLCAGTAHA